MPITEADTCRRYVLPKLYAAGWTDDQINEQKYFTDGRIVVVSRKHYRKPGKRADYLLRYRPDYPIAVVEAKAAYKNSGDGLQKAMDYVEILKLKFAYSTNGHKIIEHDFITGKQSVLDTFPSPENLWKRLREYEGIIDEKMAEDLLYPFNRTTRNPDGTVRHPRYYQEIAINRVIQAVLQGKKRVLITMASGTGKTFVAFQIIWKLWNIRWNLRGKDKKPKILYLSDRNILIDDPKDKTFTSFGDARHKIQRRVVKSREIYFAIYQAIAKDERRPGLYREYPQDFFDLIIVDECHRGSARDESNWREILEYFYPATQIGMTATPKRKDNVDTYAYFGNPIYTYSLSQGVEDGFLAPYRVHRIVPNVDVTGWRPDRGQLDRFRREIPDGLYGTKDFERIVSLLTRTECVAKNLTEYLKRTNRFDKTIVFCVDQEHAEDMRLTLHNLNTDLAKKYPHYVARVVSEEGKIGRGHLSNFQDPEKPAPVILTTSKLLSTGVDMPMCKNIVLFKPISSMVEFKQIIGRGTRLFTDKNKLWFTIIDYVGATRLFADPEFDGFPEFISEEEIDEQGEQVPDTFEIVEGAEKKLEYGPEEAEVPDLTEVPEAERRKYYVDGVEVHIVHEMVYELDSSGKKLRVIKYTDYTAEHVRKLYPSVTELRSKWTDEEERQHIIESLSERGISLERLAEATDQPDADPFDLLVHVAFNGPLRTRRERAERLKREKQDFFEQYSPKAKKILNELLIKYTDHGVNQLSDINILKIPPISNYGTLVEIANFFSGAKKLRAAMGQLQALLYTT